MYKPLCTLLITSVLASCTIQQAYTSYELNDQKDLVDFIRSIDGEVTHEHVKVEVPIHLFKLEKDPLNVELDQTRLNKVAELVLRNPGLEFTLFMPSESSNSFVKSVQDQLSMTRLEYGLAHKQLEVGILKG